MIWLVIPMEENLGDGSLILFLTFSHTSSLHKPLLAFLKGKQGFMLVLVKKQISNNNIYKITFIRYETICNETIIFSILCRMLELSHADAKTWTFIRSFLQMDIFLESVWLYSEK